MQKSTHVPVDPDELVDLGLRQHVELRAAFAAGERISLADLGSARRLVADGRRELSRQEARRQRTLRIEREQEEAYWAEAYRVAYDRRCEEHGDDPSRAAEALAIDLSGVRGEASSAGS